jgi:hypothetical protein
VPGHVLAYTTSDNAMGGAVLTFAFLIILFAIVATVLYIVLFSRPHRRVPARRLVYATAGAGAPAAPGAARAAATAAGMPTASGGGSAESATEPAGAGRDIASGAADDAAGGTGRVTDGSGTPTTDGTEGSE